MQYITTCDLSDMQWSQASLPVKDGGLRWDVCRRSHFLPFWLQRRAHSPSRTISCLATPVLTVSFCSHTWRTGRHLSVLSPKLYRETTVLRPSRYLGRPSSGEVQLEHTVGAGFFSGSLVTT